MAEYLTVLETRRRCVQLVVVDGMVHIPDQRFEKKKDRKVTSIYRESETELEKQRSNPY